MSNKYQTPTHDQWNHYLLRELGRPFDPWQVEGWQRVYESNLSLDARGQLDEDNPTDSDAIEQIEARTAESYDMSTNNYFAVSLPRDTKDIESIPALYEHLADILEEYGISNIATITLHNWHDSSYERSGYYPYLVVWRYRGAKG